MGYFGRINYNYKHKYLFSVSARYDGASSLGNEHKWGFFPGISAGWNMSRENFWKPIRHIVSTFKPRVSFGITGNISGLGDYQPLGVYSVEAKYNGQPMVVESILPNPSLQWERSKSLDIGLDMGLFNDRITLGFDHYRRVTNQLLQKRQLPPYTGFTSIITNLGSLKNDGVELSMHANVIKRKDFNWSLSANAAFNQNKILKLPDNGNKNNRIGGFLVWDNKKKKYIYKGGLQEGQPFGQMYAYKELGIYATDKEAANAPVDEIVASKDKTKHAGDVKWLDKDANGIIDSRDQVYVGNIYPDWTGGFSSTFNYKNLKLFIRASFTLGHTIFNRKLARFEAQAQGDQNLSLRAVKKSWRPNRRHTKIPRYYWADELSQNNIVRGLSPNLPNNRNSLYYEKGDYLAIREVTLSYDFPIKWLEPVGLNKLRIYVTGNNLHYFTAYKGLNPEGGGTDNGRYPVPRSIIFGIDISI